MNNCVNQTTNSTNCNPNPNQQNIAHRWLMYFLQNLPLILLGILTICANGSILIVFIRKRLLKTATNFFLVAIAFSDFLAGVVGIPIYMACNIGTGTIKHVCETHATLFAFTSLCTISFIAIITADRYIAIVIPLRYKALMTKKRAKVIITVVMVTSFILSFLPYFWFTGKVQHPSDEQRRADFIYTICILVPIVTVFPLMVYAYVRIFVEIRRQHKLTQQHERLRGNEISSIEKEVRTICVFVIMMLGYVFCWTPLGVIRVNLFFSKSYGFLPDFPRYILYSLPYVTSFLNPCCYGLGKKDFRCALNESTCAGSSHNRRRRRQGRNTTPC